MAGVHIVAWMVTIEVFAIEPFWANFPAFCVAVIASFYGHIKWKFKTQGLVNTSQQFKSLTKFVGVSLIGLAFNSLITFLVVNRAGYPYLYAGVLMVTVVPLSIFLFNKFWVFNDHHGQIE